MPILETTSPPPIPEALVNLGLEHLREAVKKAYSTGYRDGWTAGWRAGLRQYVKPKKPKAARRAPGEAPAK
jgi:hypothetical protein